MRPERADQARWRRTSVDFAITKGLIRDAVGRPDLALQHREIWHLELTEAGFPISRLTNLFPLGWAEIFQSIPARYRASNRLPKEEGAELDLPWASRYCREPEWIGEGKTVRQMMHSLLHEPIRKPVELMLVAGHGTFVHSGNNRIGASVLTGRTSIAAHACLYMWEAGDYPGEEFVREEWRSASLL